MMRYVRPFVILLFVCGAAQAATTGPAYTASLKLGKGNSATGSTLTIMGKGFDLYSLFNLSTTATAKGAFNTMSEQVDVYTSNGNARLVFFSTSGTSTISTNGNANPFTIQYTVKVTKAGASAKSTSKTIGFTAVNGEAAKSKFKFVFTGVQVDAAVAGLPTVKKGKNQVPALGDPKTNTGVTNFTLQIGSSTFVGHLSRGKVVFP